MIDIHSHLLPGVDDGSPSVEASLLVLERFAADGVEVVVCTPHLNASEAEEAPYDRHVEILGSLQARMPATPRLALGWEIMLDEPGVDLRARHLALAGSTAVLVEFPRRGVPASADRELSRLRSSGVVPVLAHPFTLFLGTDDTERFTSELVDAGLRGIEGYHGDMPTGEQEPFRKIGEKLGIVVSGGSDYHGHMRPDRTLPGGKYGVTVPPDVLGELRAARDAI